MINLLFISNSPKIELVKVHFQQILKMRIEVVEDFDQGLKDVFEKRPAVVCIQEQIGGVAGESVARHIQLLLGKNASYFILMHDGNPKARTVPGLFDCLVDISAAFEKVIPSLTKALQIGLGSHWDSIYSAPLEKKEQPSGKEVTSGLSLADQLIEDFVAEDSIFNPHNIKPLTNHELEPALETMSIFEHELPGGPPAEPQAARVAEIETKFDELTVGAQPVVSVLPPPFVTVKPLIPPPSPVEPAKLQLIEPAQIVSKQVEQPVLDATEPTVPVEQLLQAFEDNYTTRKRLVRWSLLIAGMVLLLGVFLFWMKQRIVAPRPSTASVKSPALILQQQKAVVQQPASSAKLQKHVIVKPVSIPSFIPKEGHDPAFSREKPGWSRYLSKQREYRIFHAEGRLCALQVMARGKSAVSGRELQKTLRELTGSDKYDVNRQETKDGLRLERAIMSSHAELLIYRSTKNGLIKAFVIALTP